MNGRHERAYTFRAQTAALRRARLSGLPYGDEGAEFRLATDADDGDGGWPAATAGRQLSAPHGLRLDWQPLDLAGASRSDIQGESDMCVWINFYVQSLWFEVQGVQTAGCATFFLQRYSRTYCRWRGRGGERKLWAGRWVWWWWSGEREGGVVGGRGGRGARRQHQNGICCSLVAHCFRLFCSINDGAESFVACTVFPAEENLSHCPQDFSNNQRK